MMWLWIALGVAFAGLDDRVDRLAASDPDKARAIAEAWLERHPEHRHRDEVFEALGHAIFAQGAAIDDVASWQRAYVDLRPWPELRREAKEREAQAAWRIDGDTRDVRVLRDLLERYLKTRVAREIRVRLLEVERERARGDTSKLRALHREFSAFPETRAGATQALVQAKTLDFEQASVTRSLEHWAAWRAMYAGDGVATELDARAFDLEADLVFQLRATPEALLAERDRFPDPAWRARVEDQAARRALEALWRDDFRDIPDWMSRYRDLPGLRQVAATMPEAMSERLAELDTPIAWRTYAVLFPEGRYGAVAEACAIEAAYRQAIEADTPESLLAFAADFPDHPEAANLRQRAWDLAWEATEQEGTSQAYAAFVDTYPGDPRAWQAEARQLLLTEDQGYPRAEVRKVRSMSETEQEYTVEVRGCDDQRIGGLTQGDFAVWQGMREATVSGFANNETDRPLDIVIGLDLSGSMAEEQEAVREAIRAFASQMQFRSRPFRVGLAGFSDAFEALHRLSANPTDLERWIDALPPSGGGASEDSIGSGYMAADWLGGSRAERVFILMTDEPLQINQFGYQRTLAAQDPVCDAYGSAAVCLEQCSGEVGCERACVASAPRGLEAWVQGCAPERGERACHAEAFDWLVEMWANCVGRYEDVAVMRLAATLRRQETRVFVMGPSTVQEPDFEHLAVGTGGRWLDVPDDSRSPEPYKAALLDIADELSRQYTIRALVPRGPTPLVRAPNARRWLPLGPSAMPTISMPPPAIAPPASPPSTPPPSAVPAFHQTFAVPGRDGVVLGAADDGGTWRSLDGGATWRLVDPGAGRPRWLSAAGPWVCASDEALLRCATDGGRRWAPLGQPFPTPGYGVIARSGPHTILLQGGQQHQLVAVYNRDIATSAVYFPTNVDQFDASLTPHLQAIALQIRRDPALLLQVDGHADLRGDATANEDLARRRADNVAEALHAMGVPPGQVLVRSFGERTPIRSGTSTSDLAANRRVELTVLKPLGESACDDDHAELLGQPLPLSQLGVVEAMEP